MTWEIFIPRWHPTKLNTLNKSHWAAAYKLKKKDYAVIQAHALESKTPAALRKRRVRLKLILKPGQRAGDPDAYWKVTLDGLKNCGMLVNDSHKWCEHINPKFERGDCFNWGTIITLEDI